MANGCSYTGTVQRPARSDTERLVITLAEAADYKRAVRLEVDQPDVGDIEDPSDLLCDDGEELIRRGFARDEGRDLSQGGLFGGELATAFSARLPTGRPTTRPKSVTQSSLILPRRVRKPAESAEPRRDRSRACPAAFGGRCMRPCDSRTLSPVGSRTSLTQLPPIGRSGRVPCERLTRSEPHLPSVDASRTVRVRPGEECCGDAGNRRAPR